MTIYRKIEGSNGTWYVPTNNDPLRIFIKVPGDSTGFSGKTLHLTLEDGTVEDVVGPWNSNQYSLLEDIGVDISCKTP